MKQLKILGLCALAFLLCFALLQPCLAAEEVAGYRDVPANAWYGDAAAYCRDNGLMSGTSDNTFAPGSPMNRAMLATVLYRLAGAPAVNGASSFPDVQSGAWYADAALWARQEGVISGYGDGRFGPEDPVTREQIATIFWRYEGSPAAPAGLAFTDETLISSWARNGVDWARSAGLISGKTGNRFDPNGMATRAEVATILMNYHKSQGQVPGPDAQGSVLVAYFSRTGNTATVAGYVRETAGDQLVQITTVTPYPSEYQEVLEQAQRELREDARPPLENMAVNAEEYDVIFLGYPIWHGDAPRAVCSFLESYDLDGKTIVPFATSGGSGIGASVATIRSLCPDSTVLDGLLINGSDAGSSQSRVETWIQSLNLNLSDPEETTPAGGETEDASLPQVRLTLGETRMTLTLKDNATARDLASRLPLTLTFEDYAAAEKIAYLPEGALTSQDAPSSYDPEPGDLCLYVPWGNLCFFYKDSGPNSGLAPIGSIDEDGFETLAKQSGDFTMTLEAME